MKTLKTIFILLALICANSSFAQTKEETEQWLNEKFKKITGIQREFETSNHKFKNYGVNNTLEIKDGIISIDSYDKFFVADNQNLYTKKRTVGTNLPLNKLESVMSRGGICVLRFEKYNDYGISYYESQTYPENKNKTTYEFDGGIKFYTISFYINDIEENLQERINKALQHYATFFPKEEKKKETF